MAGEEFGKATTLQTISALSGSSSSASLIKHITTTLTATLWNYFFMIIFPPTGVAAYTVGGTTFHSGFPEFEFRLKKKYFSKLSSAAEHDLLLQFVLIL